MVLQFLYAHPELAGREMQEGKLTENSSLEQARAGLDALAPEEFSVPEFAERRIQGKAWFPLHRLCQTLHQGGYFLRTVALSGQVDGGGAAYRVGTDSSHIPHTS